MGNSSILLLDKSNINKLWVIFEVLYGPISTEGKYDKKFLDKYNSCNVGKVNKEIGKSLLDEENLDFCKNILNKYPDKIVLPVDFAVTNEFTNDEEYRVKDIDNIEENEMGLDIGPETLKQYEIILSDAKSVIWNGPLGVYEFDKYKKHTDELLKYVCDNNIKTILGGGDIVAAATSSGYKDKVYHASTGGGATLEYLEGKELPGLVSIK